LLKQLAKKTNGWYELAESAEQLQRIFFKILQKAIPVATVPLTDNAFTIDSSINEFSILIFRKIKRILASLLRLPEWYLAKKVLLHSCIGIIKITMIW
jgi:hypothetical protein